MVSSIAIKSDVSPDRQQDNTMRIMGQHAAGTTSNLVSDMHSAFNALRPFDSDAPASDEGNAKTSVKADKPEETLDGLLDSSQRRK